MVALPINRSGLSDFAMITGVNSAESAVHGAGLPKKDVRQVLMTETMRWFGPTDPVSLRDIRQAGASEVVTALHEVANGDIWTQAAIQSRKAQIEAAGLG